MVVYEVVDSSTSAARNSVRNLQSVAVRHLVPCYRVSCRIWVWIIRAGVYHSNIDYCCAWSVQSDVDENTSRDHFPCEEQATERYKGIECLHTL